MASILLSTRPPRASNFERIHGVKCCSITPNNKTNYATLNRDTPPILKMAVSGATEFLRLFSPSHKKRDSEKQRDEFPVSGVDDVLMIIKSDYMNAYFLTGRELYARNLKLLVPFFDCASIRLQKIEKAVASDSNIVLATWKLRTNLKLPWRPLISINGSTFYELNEEFRIGKHVEVWDVSALEAIGQIFTFQVGKTGD